MHISWTPSCCSYCKLFVVLIDEESANCWYNTDAWSPFKVVDSFVRNTNLYAQNKSRGSTDYSIIRVHVQEIWHVFQLLGECHYWFTSESPRALVTKFYDRLLLSRGVSRASNSSVLKLIEIVVLWVYNIIPFSFSLFQNFVDITFQFLNLLCLDKDHWWGFSTRNAHMVHVVN